jgi:glycosyltransferase involved in cell wall biosynthesis
MDNFKKVSVIVPVYNAEKYLDKCIESILAQTFENIELILINDGSTDSSSKICDKYREKDSRVKVFHVQNSGPSRARNRGLELASGEYIQFVDSDDYIEENMTEDLVKEINRGADIAICGYKRICKDSHGNIFTKNIDTYQEELISKERFLYKFGSLFRDYYINYLWNKLYKAAFIKTNAIKFDEAIKWGEDLSFNLQYIDFCSIITITNKKLYNYVNYNSNSITSKLNKDLFKIQSSMYKEVKGFLMNNHSYSGENKESVDLKFSDTVYMCISDLFYSEDDHNKFHLREKIYSIIQDENVQENLPYFKKGAFKKRILGKMIADESVGKIVFLFKANHFIKHKIKKIYKVMNK